MPRHRIPIPWNLQKVVQRTVRNNNPNVFNDEDLDPDSVLLKPNIAKCIARKLGATHYDDMDLFVIDDAHSAQVIMLNEGEIPEHILAGEDPLVDDETSVVESEDLDLAQRTFNALKGCASPPVLEQQLGPKVAAREARKAYRAVVGAPGPALPADVARTIGKMSATPKLGGRKTQKKVHRKKKNTRRGRK
jgi:hypothetical protein